MQLLSVSSSPTCIDQDKKDFVQHVLRIDLCYLEQNWQDKMGRNKCALRSAIATKSKCEENIKPLPIQKQPKNTNGLIGSMMIIYLEHFILRNGRLEMSVKYVDVLREESWNVKTALLESCRQSNARGNNLSSEHWSFICLFSDKIMNT